MGKTEEEYFRGIEDVLNKMPKLKEMYEHNALATKSVDSLNHGCSPYDLIEQLVIMNIEGLEKMKEMAKVASHPIFKIG